MGGPWRERGFDPASLRSQRSRSVHRAEVGAHAETQDGLRKIVLTFIAAVAMTFGLMVSLLHRGW